jgi:elongation factor P--beta-lysine ligase
VSEVLRILLQVLLRRWFSGFVQQVVECTVVKTSVLDDKCTTATHLRILRVEVTAAVRNNHQKYLVGVPLMQMLA